MKPRLIRVLMMAGISTALCVLAVPAAAASSTPGAHPASAGAAIVCPPNDLCLQETNGATVLVPSGQSRSFSPPLQVDLIENNTSLYYCVEVGLIIYIDVPPGAVESGTRTVYGVMPGRICPG